MSSIGAIPAEKLVCLIGVPHGPALIDVRSDEDFVADPRLIPGSVRRHYQTASSWAPEFAGRSTVVICERGQKLSEDAAAWLRNAGASSAEVLLGGHAAWVEEGLPLVPEGKLPPRDPQGRTIWVTRERPKIVQADFADLPLAHFKRDVCTRADMQTRRLVPIRHNGDL
jgi:rhodanese-related sulfurtransferase